MTTKSPVPRLDLAPKLSRPLSLWNPLDYLRLLYWVFFFPQALRWYIDTFGGGYIPEQKVDMDNSIQRQLLFQGVFLTIFTPIFICLLLQELALRVNWFSVVLGVALGVIFSILGSMAFTVARSVPFGLAFGVVFGVAFGVVGVAFGAALGVAFGVALGVAFGVTGDVRGGVAYSVAFTGTFGLVGIVFGVVFGVLRGLTGVVGGVTGGVTFGVVVGVTFSVAVLRPENWLICLPLNLLYSRNGNRLFSRVTRVPLPYLNSRLQNWLQQDWENGIHNVNQLLAYTMQSASVIEAVNHVLNTISSDKTEVIGHISRLADNLFDWQLIKDISDLEQPSTEKPHHAAAAGFWYFHEKQPNKATEAFAVVRSLLYGEEMCILAQTLAEFNDAKELNSIANLQLPTFSTEGLLRPVTWQTLDRFLRVIEDVRIINSSLSPVSRSSALNRALGELTNILNTADTLPKAEQGLIIDIAENWRKQLLQIAAEVGEVVINKPVNNPYVIGDPVMGNLFVGREDIIRQLEELWLRSHQLQSVVIYGHRRMGKTSILRNAANSLDNQVKVAYVNLLKLGDVTQGVGEVLMAISDEISQVVNIEPPNDDDLLKLPERTFDRYFKEVINNLSSGLIIALDEFEKIENLINSGKINPDFMGFLRGLLQTSPKVAFAFAGLHTLEEMTADYFHPFFRSVIDIPVGFLSRGATGQILANPAIEEFLLDYTPEALDKIYDLTYGQPYLVQLIGFHLVQLYNDFVFEQGRNRDPVFTVEDVEAVVNKQEFFTRGSNYFNGVWGQAGENGNTQQVILSHLAKSPQGLSVNDLVELMGIDEGNLQTALEILKRHDVIAENQGRWRIIVELFRRWVFNKFC